jgi:hypothetical protein
MNQYKNRQWQRAVFLATITLCVVAVALTYLYLRGGIRVTIVNEGPTAIRSVVLYVTGASYPLGDIPEESTRQATVMSQSSESHLEIGFIDAEGKARQLNAGGYFEPGYRGNIRIRINDKGNIEENEQKIKAWIF